MSPFVAGLITGGVAATLMAGVVAIFAYRSVLRLQENSRQVQRLAELGTLTSGLAHEIKNPLSTVQLNLQLLGEDLHDALPDDSRLASRLSTVQKETKRLREILDDFMRYAGKIEIERHPVDVNEMLQELVDFFTPQAQMQRIQLRLKQADGPLRVNLDERLIKQAILNLMINATQAMPEDGGEIILSARRENQLAMIEVIDTGRGIAPESVAKIFDAYYSTKSGGTGLGLAITRRVVQEHGGNISLRSEVGKGTDFTIALPI